MSRSFLVRLSSGFLAALMALTLSGCKEEEAAATTVVEAKVLKVSAQQPKIDYIEQRANFTGRIMPDDSVSVFGKSAGTVLKTYFEIGDTVEEGQLLFELDPKDYQIALEQARLAYESTLNSLESAENGAGDALTELQYKAQITNAENAYQTALAALEGYSNQFPDGGVEFSISKYRKARNAYEEAAKVWEKDPTPENYQAYVTAESAYEVMLDDYGDRVRYQQYFTQFETAYDAYLAALEQYEIYKSMQRGENLAGYDISRQQAKLQYDSMLQTMDNLKVYSPISGVIEAKNVSENAMYANSMAGYVVSNKDIMVVTFGVSGDIVNEMSIGDEVIVENGNQQYGAEITEIGSMVNASSGLFTIKARLTDEANVLSGVTVKLTAITSKSESGLLIPVSSVYYDDGDTYVYVEREGQAVVAPVELGIISGDLAEVTDGLSVSDNVITSWSPNLSDGVAVEISEEV